MTEKKIHYLQCTITFEKRLFLYKTKKNVEPGHNGKVSLTLNYTLYIKRVSAIRAFWWFCQCVNRSSPHVFSKYSSSPTDNRRATEPGSRSCQIFRAEGRPATKAWGRSSAPNPCPPHPPTSRGSPAMTAWGSGTAGVVWERTEPELSDESAYCDGRLKQERERAAIKQRERKKGKEKERDESKLACVAEVQ